MTACQIFDTLKDYILEGLFEGKSIDTIRDNLMHSVLDSAYEAENEYKRRKNEN